MRKSAILLAALVALATVWYLASPYWAQHRLIAALNAGDQAEIARDVDFPAVRASLKDQLDQRIGRDAGDNLFAQMGAAVVASVADRMVDWLVTPDGLRRLVATGHAEASGDHPDATRWHVAYEGIDRFDLVATPDRAEAQPARLVFHRAGLSWVLSGLVLPESHG